MSNPTPTVIEAHRADALTIDPRTQRVLRPHIVKKIRASLDLDAIGVITANRRKGGALAVLDGQHRVVALREEGLGEWEITCRIFEGLSIQEEAALFRKLNTYTRPSAVDDFLKGVVAKDGECVAINRIVEFCGFEIHPQATHHGGISAVAALRKVYRDGGGDALSKTLALAREAWGVTPEATAGQIIDGLGRVVTTFNGEVDYGVLANKLAKYPGGASGLIGKARMLNDIRRKPVAGCVAEIVVNTYNTGRRAGRIADL